MKDDIRRWIESGADVPSGLRFLALLSPNPPLARLLTLKPREISPAARSQALRSGRPRHRHSPGTRKQSGHTHAPGVAVSLLSRLPGRVENSCRRQKSPPTTTTSRLTPPSSRAPLPRSVFSTAKKVMENFIEKSENHFRICVLQGTPPPAGSAPCLQGTARGIEAAQTVYTPTMPAPG